MGLWGLPLAIALLRLAVFAISRLTIREEQACNCNCNYHLCCTALYYVLTILRLNCKRRSFESNWWDGYHCNCCVPHPHPRETILLEPGIDTLVHSGTHTTSCAKPYSPSFTWNLRPLANEKLLFHAIEQICFCGVWKGGRVIVSLPWLQGEGYARAQ